jgi:hypothetical protein
MGTEILRDAEPVRTHEFDDEQAEAWREYARWSAELAWRERWERDEREQEEFRMWGRIAR